MASVDVTFRVEAVDELQIHTGYEMILKGLGIEADDHTESTPRRATAALMEMCAGLYEPPPEMRTFPGDGPPQMIVLGDIPVKSLCAHHLLPFVGTAVVGYIPSAQKNVVLGLSKLSRAVNYWSRRPQVQERLTHQVSSFLFQALGPGSGVGVVIQANHSCMELRGVDHPGHMVTSSLKGLFTEPDVKAEFMALARRWIK